MFVNDLVATRSYNFDAIDAALGISFEKEDLLDESIDTIIGLLDYIADAYGEGSYMYRELAPVEDKLKRVLKLVEEEYDEE